MTKIVPQSEKMMELIGGVMDDDAVRGVRAIGNCLVEMHRAITKATF